MNEDREFFEKKREQIKERVSDNLLPGFFVTFLFCRSLYVQNYTFLYLLVPLSVYMLWKLWKKGRLWDYVNSTSAVLVFDLFAIIYLINLSVKDNDIKGLLPILIYSSLFLIPVIYSMVKDFITSIRGIK